MNVSEDAAYYVGVDWAAEVHAVCVLDHRGKIVISFPVAHSADGIAALVARLARLGPAEEIPIGIERPNGRLVDLLLEAGHPWCESARTRSRPGATGRCCPGRSPTPATPR